MFSGYHFFDYKGDISGYNGYDYDHFGRWLYLILGVITIVTLLIVFHKAKRATVDKYLKIMSITMTSLYIIKTTWESIHDINHGLGFNLYLLPFDTCSMLMFAGLIAGWAKGKLKEAGACWLATGGIVGGIATMMFLKALSYYPFFTFGAFYSMLWHVVMAFTGIWLLVTNYVKSDFRTILYGFIFHMAFSIIVIPFDYIMKMDFMMYYGAGGVPLIEGVADKLAEKNLRFITTLIMIAIFFGLFNGVVYTSRGIKELIALIKRHTHKEEVQEIAPVAENE